MLTSLLSFYIAAVIDTHLAPQSIATSSEPSVVVKTASFDFSDIEDSSIIPIKNPEFISPIINAEGSIATDLKTGSVLYEKNAHKRLPMASITKLMTILITLEENSMDEVVTISGNAAAKEGSQMYLRTGEQITVKDLLLGAIIHSANDAATALAEHNAGSVEEFVGKMNKKASSLGLVNTHYANATGLDDPDNYSSAYDLAKLAKYLYQKEFIRNAAVLKEMEVYSVDGKYTHKLKSTNNLLDSFLNIKGLKTGSTDAAGLCLVTVAENDTENDIITVVLHSPARFTESKILIDWVFRAYNWQQ